MKTLLAYLAGLGIIILATIVTGAYGQNAGQFDSSLAEHNLAGEKDKDGDRIQVNLKSISGTPTPAAAGRCLIECRNSQLAFADASSTPAAISGCGCAGAGTNSVRVGSGATAAGASSVSIGKGTDASALQSVAVGMGASASGTNCTTVGYGSSCSSTSTLCLGSLCTATGSQSVCIGHDALCTNGGNCIGDSCQASASNKLGIGSVTVPIQNLCVGHGCGTTSESVAGQVQASDLTGGTNKNAGPLQLRGGAGTGTGLGGNIQFRYCPSGSSGSSVNTCSTAWHLDGSTGNLIADVGTLGAQAAPVPAVHTTDQYTYGRTSVVPIEANVTSTSFAFNATNASAYYITGNGDYTLASQPTVTTGENGQILWIWNVGAHTITLHEDGDGGVASNLQLGATSRALAQNDGLCLYYIGVLGDWVECGFVNN